MKTIIFKSDKKAKLYEIKAAKDFGVYSMGELIRKVKTDDIDRLNEGWEIENLTIKEI